MLVPSSPAASQNIGEALAIELAARGHNLIITARREDVLRALADRITGQYGVTVEVRPVDLADPSERAKLCDELALRNISILCANAGTATFGPVAALDPEGEKAQVQLNVLGVHDLTLAVLPGMTARKAGGILISGSVAGNSPIPNKRHVCGEQGVRQHVQRVFARRAQARRRARHRVGARSGTRDVAGSA